MKHLNEKKGAAIPNKFAISLWYRLMTSAASPLAKHDSGSDKQSVKYHSFLIKNKDWIPIYACCTSFETLVEKGYSFQFTPAQASTLYSTELFLVEHLSSSNSKIR